MSEVENALLLPKPFVALAKLLMFDDKDAKQRLETLKHFVFESAHADADRCILDATRRRIDYASKAVGLEAKSIDDLVTEFAEKVANINPTSIYNELRTELDAAVAAADYVKVLRLYDNKGLLSQASRILGLKGRKELEEFIGRALLGKDGETFLNNLRDELPRIQVSGTSK